MTAPIGRRRLLGGLAGLAGLGSAALAGCLGDGSTPSPAWTAGTATAPTDAQARFPDFEWSRLEGVEAVATDGIAMRDFEFHPLVATVPPGTAVTVTNEDSAGHELSIPGLGVDAVLDGGESMTFGTPTPGTDDYVCEFHPPSMLGRLVVSEDATLPTATE